MTDALDILMDTRKIAFFEEVTHAKMLARENDTKAYIYWEQDHYETREEYTGCTAEVYPGGRVVVWGSVEAKWWEASA